MKSTAVDVTSTVVVTSFVVEDSRLVAETLVA